MSMQVTLEHAYHWVCPYCGTSNWQLAVPIALTKEDFEATDEDELQEAMDLEPWETIPVDELEGVVLSHSAVVCCSRCESHYQAVSDDE